MTLLAAYSFDGTGDAVVDHSGNRDFTLAGADAQRIDAGHTDGGLEGTQSFTATTVAEPPFGQTTNRTLMMWAKGDGAVWYARWQVDSIGSGAWGILLLSGEIGAWGRNASGSANAAVPVPSDGLWHHYAATYDETASELRFYLDGAEAASATLAGPLRTDADRFDICEFASGTTVDDLRIYDAALTDAEIVDAMNTPVTTATVNGSAVAALGGLQATASGHPTVFGSASAELGALSAAATVTIPTPRARTLTVATEKRTYAVKAEPRTILIGR